MLSSSLWPLQTAAAPCVNRDKLLCCMTDASLYCILGAAACRQECKSEVLLMPEQEVMGLVLQRLP